ncbi:MAG: hypothetical protein ABI693_34775 [Bryobacteraceae bacterium]
MQKLILFGCLLSAGSLLMAQDDAPLRDAMKKIGPATGALGKKIAAKDATAAADAEKLAMWFHEVHGFWEARKAPDAVEFAKTAAEQFGEVGKLAAAGSWDEAAATQKKIGASCMGCHTAHREKAPDGSWKTK